MMLRELLCMTAVALAARGAAAADLWIAPGGDDANPGTQARPLKTIDGARLAVRRGSARGHEPITVHIQAGTYYLPSTLVFQAEDSGSAGAPITYAAADNARVVVSGGLRISPRWRPYARGIMQADVPAGLDFDQLFVNGRRQPMARYPDYDPNVRYFQGFAPDCISPQRVARWSNPAGGFFHAMHRNLWGDMHWLILGKTADGNLKMIGGWQNNRPSPPHKKYRFVENIFEELDAPCEWYLDRKKHVLYYYPPAGLDLARAKVEVVRLRRLVEFRGRKDRPVRFITLRGLTFTHARRTFMENKEPLLRSDWTTYRGGAIMFDGAEDCSLQRCVIDQVGGNAVFVNGYNRRVSVVGCRISDAGASSVSFVGAIDAVRSALFGYRYTNNLAQMDKTPGPRNDHYPADCLVADCLIYRNGRVEKQTAGVNICIAESITVRHCSIYDCPRAGINICAGPFGGHVIEFNDVFDTVKETGDHGSFNSWGRDRFWNPDRAATVEWVRKYPDMPKWDCQKTVIIRNNRWRCDHGWDIDLDDGSSNYDIYDNLCLAGGIKLREGYYRSVHNNVIVDYTFCPHVWYPDCHTSFMHNIIWRAGYAPAGMRKTDQVRTVDYNLVHQAGAKAHPAAGLRKFGGDRHSIIADAMFVDPLAGDYRVRDGSPALALGFKNFPMDRFGVVSPALRKIARTPPLPGSLEAATVRSGGWHRNYTMPRTAHWLDAEVRNILDMNDMSAVGLGDKKGVLVLHVPPGGRAAKAGLKDNDVIRAVNGKAVENLAAFAKAWAKRPADAPAVLTVWRSQGSVTLKVPPK
ncbi:MAG: PDZ domain-containing protein [Planctomycetes bacterium]|nr:PDZ domain-containing protein [Planctomycetota bacterium]